jgi:hypothetical protein
MIGQFDELAVRHNAAMAAYLTMYEARAPRPQKEQISRDIVSLITMVALAIVMIAAVIVSSSRTVDEFGGGAIGATAFVMVEGGIMAYAFFRARRNANKTRLQNTVRWATAGLILTFVVGLGANTDATMKHLGIELPTWINTVIHILVAISAPTLAFISSDVLAIELMATDIKRRDAEDHHKTAMDEWWTGFNRSWISQQKNWGVKVEIEPQRQLSRDNSSNLIKNNEISRFKPSPKLQKALDYLRLNEGDLFTAPRELEAKITGVSYGTIHKAQQIIRSENGGES